MSMKRFCSLIMALVCVLLAALGLCSCDGNEEGSTTAGTFGIVYNGVVVELDSDFEYEIYDVLGNKYADGKLCHGIHKIPAKNCEIIKLK